MISRRSFLFCFSLFSLSLFITRHAHAYDRDAAVNYIKLWWNTDLNDDNYVDFYNSPLLTDYKDVNHISTGPYLFQYDTDGRGNAGDDTIWENRGEDCANFGSQVLIAGGIDLSPIRANPKIARGPGTTVIRAGQLGALLFSISKSSEFWHASEAPDWLEKGDIIIWEEGHTTEVTSATGRDIRLAAHSYDTFADTLGHYFGHGEKYATAFHITRDKITVPLDINDPDVKIRTRSRRAIEQRTSIPEHDVDIELTDDESGIRSLDISTGAATLNDPTAVLDGRAKTIFADTHAYGSSHVYELRDLPEGQEIFVQAYDRAGNATLTSFFVQAIPPKVVAYAPQNNGAALSSSIVITLSERPDAQSVEGSLLVRDRNGVIPGDLALMNEREDGKDWNGDGDMEDDVLIFNPKSPWMPGATINVTLRDSLKDLSGIPLDGNGDGSPGGDFQWSFNVEVPPPSFADASVDQAYAGDDLVFDSTITAYLSSVQQAKVYYRKATDRSGRYTAIDLQPVSNFGSASVKEYTGSIPGDQISVKDGLEYFLWAQDSIGRTSTWPPNIGDPFLYSSTAATTVVFGDNQEGKIILGDADIKNDRLNASVRLVDDVPFGHHVEVAVYSAKHDFSPEIGDLPVYRVAGAFPGFPPAGVYSFSIDGTALGEGNYYYTIEELDGTTVVNTIVSDARFWVVKPFAQVGVSIARSGNNDIVSAAVTGTGRALFAGTDYKGNSPFHASAKLGSGPTYQFSVPHSAKGQGVGVYAQNFGREQLIGFSGVPRINTDNAPEISTLLVTDPQTNNHPITVVAAITDLTKSGDPGVVSSATLFYKSVDGIFTSVPMVAGEDDSFSADIPPQPGGNTVYYYIEAVDSDGLPASDPWFNPQASAYHFDVQVDLTPPTVLVNSLTPSENQDDVSVRTTFNVNFSENIRPLSYSPEAIQVRDASNNPVEMDASSFVLAKNGFSIHPTTALRSQTTYFVTIGDSIRDLSGNPLDGDGNGTPGGNFTWAFQTEALMPAALYSLTAKPQNLTATDAHMEFSAIVSTPVSSISIVLKNLLSDKEYRLTDSSGTSRSAAYPFSYKKIWDGKTEDGPIPEGAYSWRLEGTHFENGLVGTSESQPFRWSLSGEATVTYSKVATGIIGGPRGLDNFFSTNEDQIVSADYNYDGSFLDVPPASSLVDCHGSNFNLGTHHDREAGKSGRWGVPVRANCQTWLSMNSGIDSLKVEYYRRYYHSRGLDHFETVPTKSHVEALGEGETFDATVAVKFDPHKEDLEDTEGNTRTVGVSVTDAHFLTTPLSDDFDDNPMVRTQVSFSEIAPFNGANFQIKVHASNLSKAPASFIYDVTPPSLGIDIDNDVFSSSSNQNVAIDFHMNDNLPFGLRNDSMQVKDVESNVVRTLYVSSSDISGDRALKWFGENDWGNILPDGVYTLNASAADAVGNSTEVVHQVILDNTPPVLSGVALQVDPGTHPNVFTSHDNQIQVLFKVSDNFSPRVNAVLWLRNVISGSTYSVADVMDVSASPRDVSLQSDGKDSAGNPISDGNYEIELEASDGSQNKTKISLGNLKIDRTPPLFNYLFASDLLFTPDDGVSGTGDGNKDSTTVHYQVSEDALVQLTIERQSGEILFKQQIPAEKNVDSSFTWDGKVDGKYVSDGSYVVRALTRDDVGNEATESVVIIKNAIPAKFNYPFDKGAVTKVKGRMILAGTAVDPFVNDTIPFAQYELWVRNGDHVNFSLPENNPAHLDLAKWKPIDVPISYQNSNTTINPDYPNSNVSERSILNGTLGIWDTIGLTEGSTYTLLLSVKDKSDRISYDVASAVIDSSADDSAPTIALTHPEPEKISAIDFLSASDFVPIEYTLSQDVAHVSHVMLEIFRINDLGNPAEVVYVQDLFNQDSGGTIKWNGHDSVGRLVTDGRYRVRLTALDEDNSGTSSSEGDVQLHILYSGPVKVEDFSTSKAVVALGEEVTLTYKISKPAKVVATAFDLNGATIAQYTSTSAAGSFTFSRSIEGLYHWVLTAESLEIPITEDSSSLSVAVGLNPGPGPEITGLLPAPSNGTVQGVANYRWAASAKGKFYPPQDFQPTLNISGEKVTQSKDFLDTDFIGGKLSKVAVIGGDLVLDKKSENQSQESSNGKTTGSYDSSEYFAQSVLPQSSGVLKHAEFYIEPPDLPVCYKNDVLVQVRADNGGQPGSILAEVDLGSLNNKPTGWYGADFSLPVIRGTRFWIVTLWHSKFKPWTCGFLDDSKLGKHYGTTFNSYGDGQALFGGNPENNGPPVWYQGTDFRGMFWANVIDLKFRVSMEGYTDSGRYVSTVIDTSKSPAGKIAFEPLHANFSTNGQNVNFKIQTSDDGSTWSNEIPLQPDQPIPVVAKRYLRNIIDLSTTDNSKTPVVHDYGYKYKVIEPTSISKTLPGPFSVIKPIPLFIPPKPSDLASLFPDFSGPEWISGPNFSVINSGNPNVTLELTKENGPLQLKATTGVLEDWDLSMDSGVSGSTFGNSFAEFNNDPNPLNFTDESPFGFSSTDFGLKPQTISAGYPNVNMFVSPAVKNKYAFWKDFGGQTVDNPYVAIDASAGGWDLKLSNPDGTVNDAFKIKQDLSKLSNTNKDPLTVDTPWDLDDDFTVKLVSGKTPKVFLAIRGANKSSVVHFFEKSLFFRAVGDESWRSIPVLAPHEAVGSDKVLAYWDVTGLHGDYQVKLVSVDGDTVTESIKKFTIGSLVPGSSHATGTTVVAAAVNKAYLEFSASSLDHDSLVTITPKELKDSSFVIPPGMPLPLGSLYDIQPRDISFARDTRGDVISPASLTVRFLPDELKGIDPSKVTLYGVTPEGKIQPLDARVKVLDHGITEITSPWAGYSTVVALPKLDAPVLTAFLLSKNDVDVNGDAGIDGIVSIQINGVNMAKVGTDPEHKFHWSIQLPDGKNTITAVTTIQLGIDKNLVALQSPVSSPVQMLIDSRPASLQSISVAPKIFSPAHNQTTKISFLLTSPAPLEVAVETPGCSTCTEIVLPNAMLAAGAYEFTWNGKDHAGNELPLGNHQVRLTMDQGPAERVFTATVTTVDNMPPVVNITSPAEGQVFRMGRAAIPIRFSVVDLLDPLPLWLANLESRTGDKKIRVDTGASVDPSDLSNGEWRLVVETINSFGEKAIVDSGWFKVEADVAPPAPVADLRAVALSSSSIQLSWTLTSGNSLSGNTFGFYRVSMSRNPRSEFSVDRYLLENPIELKSGLSTATVISNLNPETYYAFTVWEADDNLNWSQASNIASTETLSDWFRDQTPPRSSFVLRTTTGPIEITAVDVSSNEVASGVSDIFYQLDSKKEHSYSAPIDVTLGHHTLSFYSVDKAGNRETENFVEFDSIEHIPPAQITDLSVSTVTTSGLTLTWTMPGDDGSVGETDGQMIVATGRDLSEIPEKPTDLWKTKATPVHLTPGQRQVWTLSNLDYGQRYLARVFVADSEGNWSAGSNIVSTATLGTDNTPPVTTVNYLGLIETEGDKPILASKNKIEFLASDPTSSASIERIPTGINLILVGVDHDPMEIYVEPLSLPSGEHTIRYQSIDNASNVEELRVRSLAVKADGSNPPPINPTVALSEESVNIFRLSKHESAQIKFSIAKPGHALVVLYDQLGREIGTLFNQDINTQPQTVIWDGKDSTGRTVRPGVYSAYVKTSEGTRILKIVALD